MTGRRPPLLASLAATMLIAGCATAPGAAPADQAATPTGPSSTLSAEDPLAFFHPASGMAFPRNVAGFASHDIYHYDDDGKNVSVGYRPVDDDLVIMATLYVYPVGEATAGLAAHFEELKQVIATQRDGAQLIGEGEMSLTQGPLTFHGRRAHFMYQPIAEDTLPMQISHLFLFEHGKWVFKYRVTFLAFQHETADPAVIAWMEALRWPSVDPSRVAAISPRER